MESIDRPIARKATPLARGGRIAAPQHGVVARRQLLRAGLSRDVIDHMVATGRLLPLYRGVYAVGHRPVGPRSREMAVVLLAGESWPLGVPQRGRTVGDPAALARPRPMRSGHEVAKRPGLRDPPHARPAGRGRLHPLGHPGHHPAPDAAGPVRHTLSLDALDAALAEALVRKLVAAGRRAAPGDLDAAARCSTRRCRRGRVSSATSAPLVRGARPAAADPKRLRRGAARSTCTGRSTAWSRSWTATGPRASARVRDRSRARHRPRGGGMADGPRDPSPACPARGDGPTASSRTLLAPRGQAGAGSWSGLTSTGSPRSGNGTSIASKSRGTTVRRRPRAPRRGSRAGSSGSRGASARAAGRSASRGELGGLAARSSGRSRGRGRARPPGTWPRARAGRRRRRGPRPPGTGAVSPRRRSGGPARSSPTTCSGARRRPPRRAAAARSPGPSVTPSRGPRPASKRPGRSSSTSA